MRAIACISCRLRRRKCDRKKPLCSGCKDLNIPAELCIFKDLRTKSKSNDKKVILDQVKTENRRLKRVKFTLMSAMESRIDESIKLSSSKSQSNQTVKDETAEYSQIPDVEEPQRKNSVQKSKIELKPNFGSISWGSLMSAEPEMQALLVQIDTIIKMQKEQLISLKKKFEPPLQKKNAITNTINKMTAVAMGAEVLDDYQVFQDLFDDIERNFPNYNTLKICLDHQFRLTPLDYTGFFAVDEEKYYEVLHRVVHFNPNGDPRINIKLPEQLDMIMDLAYIISYFIFMACHRSQLDIQLNHNLFLDYSTALLQIHSLLGNILKKDNSFLPSHTPEELHTLLYITTFDRYTVHGRYTPQTNLDNSLNSRQLTVMARTLHLNENIDVYYAGTSEIYRKSLKSTWFLLVLIDIMSSIEGGMPPKIKPHELIRYEDHYNPHVEALIVMNRVLNKFHSLNLDTLDDTLKFVQIVENDLVRDLKMLLKYEVRSPRQDIEYLQTFDFNDISQAGRFMVETSAISMKYNIYSMLQTLYFICFKKLETLDKDSKETKKFNILSTKYSTLIVSLTGELFFFYEKLISLPNSFEFAVIETLLAIFPHISLALRRVYICAGARIFKSLPISRASAVKRLFNGNNSANESAIMKELHLKQEFQISFEIEDLADYDVDEDANELIGRFSPLLDNRFFIFNFSQVMKQMSEALLQEKSKMTFLKSSHVFFYMLKLSGFFFNATFVGEDDVSTGNQASMGINCPKPEDESVSEFNFKELFERAIDTNSENFDFKEFFNNDVYQSTDIDEFLSGYPMALLGTYNK